MYFPTRTLTLFHMRFYRHTHLVLDQTLLQCVVDIYNGSLEVQTSVNTLWSLLPRPGACSGQWVSISASLPVPHSILGSLSDPALLSIVKRIISSTRGSNFDLLVKTKRISILLLHQRTSPHSRSLSIPRIHVKTNMQPKEYKLIRWEQSVWPSITRWDGLSR